MFAPGLDQLWKNWKQPPELSWPAPRPVKLTGYGIGLIVMAALFAVGGIAFGIGMRIVAQHEDAELKQLLAEGRTAQATVTRLWRTGGKSSQNMAAYAYSVDGREYHSSHALQFGHWRALETGSEIEIRYLPSDPARNFPESDPIEPMPFWVPVFMASVFLFAAGAIYYQVSRQRRLLQEGRAAPGIVTGNRRAKQNSIRYDFALAEGGKARGRSQRPYTPEGTVICVLYDPENPRRNVIYPCQYARIARNG